MNLINQNQIRGLVESIQSLQTQIANLDAFSITGGLITGDVSIDSNLTVEGSLNVSGDPFYFNTGNGTFGINIASPSGDIHLYSDSDSVSIWLESNPFGSSPENYPSIKFLNFESGVSSEIGIVPPNNTVFTEASGNAFFINHGADLVEDEYSQDRIIQFAINGDSVAELETGKMSVFGAVDIGSSRLNTLSSSLSGQEITLDTVNMSSFGGVVYNLAVFNNTGSRAEEFLMTWNTGTNDMNYTGIKSPSVNSTSDIVISGYKSGAYALLRANASANYWNIAGMANYLF